MGIAKGQVFGWMQQSTQEKDVPNQQSATACIGTYAIQGLATPQVEVGHGHIRNNIVSSLYEDSGSAKTQLTPYEDGELT
jgi:hypothetical protein